MTQKKIIKAKNILTFCPDGRGGQRIEFLQDSGILFDKKIIKIAPLAVLENENKAAKVFDFGASIIAPIFTNPHIHFEYSSLANNFAFGEFGRWLDTIMANKAKIDPQNIKKAIDDSLSSGTASVGAISSFGLDLDYLNSSKLKGVIFHEALGQEGAFEPLMQRINKAKDFQNFKTALAIHAPYSTSKPLARRILEFASKNDFLVSTHFLESLEEKRFFADAKPTKNDYFYKFFEKLGATKIEPYYKNEDDFLAMFREFNMLEKSIFVHCLQADLSSLKVDKIITCPRSNKLLTNTYLALKNVDSSTTIGIGTDGMSSNFSLSMLDELKFALFAYDFLPLRALADYLYICATANNASILNLQTGTLQAGYDADFCVFDIGEIVDSLHMILGNDAVRALFVNGEKIL